MKFSTDGEHTCTGCGECGTFTLQDHGLLDAEGTFLCCTNCGGLIEVEVIDEQASRLPDDRENDSGLIAEARWPMPLDPRGGG